MVYIYVVQNLCTVVQTQPKRRVLDRADYTAPTRQHDLNHTDHADHTDHTDHTDQEFICPEDTPGTVDHLVGIECLSHAWMCPTTGAIVIRPILHTQTYIFHYFHQACLVLITMLHRARSIDHLDRGRFYVRRLRPCQLAVLDTASSGGSLPIKQ